MDDVLRGERCLLRPVQDDDAEALARLADDVAVVRYLRRTFPHPYTRDDAVRWIASRRTSDEHPYAVVVEGAFAGIIGYTPGADDRSGTVFVGYWFGAPFWGRGIASEALRLVTARIEVTPGVRRIWSNVMAANAASARVLEKCGYHREATLKDAIADREGNLQDELIYAKMVGR